MSKRRRNVAFAPNAPTISEHFVCGFCGGNKMLNIGDGGHGCDECGHYQYTN